MGDMADDLERTMETPDEPEQEKLGPTGKFPDGKLSPDDEGEINLEVSCGPGVVKLDFGIQVRWIALPPDGALELAALLAAHAGKATAALEEQAPTILKSGGSPS